MAAIAPAEPRTDSRTPYAITHGQIIRHLVSTGVENLKVSEWRVWAILLAHTNLRTGSCTLYQRTIQAEAKLGRRAVIAATARLEELGLVKRIERLGRGQAGARYTYHMQPQLLAIPASDQVHERAPDQVHERAPNPQPPIKERVRDGEEREMRQISTTTNADPVVVEIEREKPEIPKLEELVTHPRLLNQTPNELLEAWEVVAPWMSKLAPTMTNPGGFIADRLRDGDPPPSSWTRQVARWIREDHDRAERERSERECKERWKAEPFEARARRMAESVTERSGNQGVTVEEILEEAQGFRTFTPDAPPDLLWGCLNNAAASVRYRRGERW